MGMQRNRARRSAPISVGSALPRSTLPPPHMHPERARGRRAETWHDVSLTQPGHANTSDEQHHLYRQVQLSRMGQREMVYADCWDSVEAYKQTLLKYAGTPFLEVQAKMRPRVE